MLLPGPFRPIREQPGTEGHRPAVFLRLLPSQNTPHNCRHAHQMVFKTHSEWKNRHQCCIPTRLQNKQITSTRIAILGKLAFLCLRLRFGIKPAPEEYTTISEAEIDLGNDLLIDASWDATKLESTHRQLIPREDYLPDLDQLVKADQLEVNIKVKEASMDGFIYDIITITIDKPC